MAKRDRELKPHFEIEDLKTLEVLVDSLRMRILFEVIRSACTVRELADEFGLPATRLYYHLNLMLAAGIIRVSAREKIGAMTQRRFRAVARAYAPSNSLSELLYQDRRANELVTHLVLESARVDAEALLRSYRVDSKASGSKGAFGRTFFKLKPERVEYWIGRMAEVIEEIQEESAEDLDGELYGFTFVLAPLAGAMRGAIP